MKPTQDQINAEISILKELLSDYRGSDSDACDAREDIQSQISVLTENWTVDSIYTHSHCIGRPVDAAWNAFYWAAGEECAAPSSDWRPLEWKRSRLSFSSRARRGLEFFRRLSDRAVAWLQSQRPVLADGDDDIPF